MLGNIGVGIVTNSIPSWSYRDPKYGPSLCRVCIPFIARHPN